MRKPADRKGSLPSKKVPRDFFWTVTNSPQWKAWDEAQFRRQNYIVANKHRKISHGAGIYDMAEVMECGWISQQHFEDFMKFSAIEYMLRLPIWRRIAKD